jgi:hypothetical protein
VSRSCQCCGHIRRVHDVNGLVEGGMEGRTDRRMGGWKDGKMDGWT